MYTYIYVHKLKVLSINCTYIHTYIDAKQDIPIHEEEKSTKLHWLGVSPDRVVDVRGPHAREEEQEHVHEIVHRDEQQEEHVRRRLHIQFALYKNDFFVSYIIKKKIRCN